MLSNLSWQTPSAAVKPPPLPPLPVRSGTIPNLEVHDRRTSPSNVSRMSSPSQHRKSSLAKPHGPPSWRPTDLELLQRGASESTKTLKQVPERLSRPLPDPPPIEVPAPLQLRRKSTIIAPDSPTATDMPTNDMLQQIADSQIAVRGEMVSSDKARMIDPNAKNGLSARQRVKETLQSKQMAELQLEAKKFGNKALPATPGSAAPTPQEVWQPRHRHNRSASSERIVPTTPLSPLHRGFEPASNAKIKNTAPQTPLPMTDLASLCRLADLPLDSATYSPDRNPSDPAARLALGLKLRSGSIVTVVPPEQTAWERTAYNPGPIIIQRSGRLTDTPLSPMSSGGFSFNPDIASTTLDLFKDILDDSASTHTKRSEDTTLSEIARYVEGYGFDAVSFGGDEFWLDNETRSIRSRMTSMTSAELSFYYRSNSPSVSSATPHDNLAVPKRRLSNGGVYPAQKHDGFTDCYSPSSERMSYQGMGTSLGPTTPRRLPPSPATSSTLLRRDSMSERERKAALKRMGAGSSGASQKVGFMRLLRGAGTIV